MVEVVRATKREPFDLIDRKVLGEVISYGVPILMAVVFLLSLTMTIQRGSFLRAWSTAYGAEDSYLVLGCSPVDNFTGNQWSCSGRLESNTPRIGSSTLVTSRDAASSERLYVGQRVDVFHAASETATVYPLQDKLNEMTRLYLSLLPRLLVLIGSMIWLVGWAMTRKHDAADFISRDSLRFPQRFSWQGRGTSWIIAGLVVLVLNHFLTVRVLGSLGIL